MNYTVKHYIPYPVDSRHTHRKLSHCTRNELIDLQRRNRSMLNNHSLIATLPDKGARIRESNQMIDILLNNQVMVTPESICPLTRKMEDMSVLTPRQGARKRSVDLANQQALSNDCISSSLLRKKKPSLHNNTCSIFSMDAATNQPTNDHSAKVRMLSLKESMVLQQGQRDDNLNVSQPSQSVLESLNLTMAQILDVEEGDFVDDDTDEDDMTVHYDQSGEDRMMD